MLVAAALSVAQAAVLRLVKLQPCDLRPRLTSLPHHLDDGDNLEYMSDVGFIKVLTRAVIDCAG
jgi:hypothetical protein